MFNFYYKINITQQLKSILTKFEKYIVLKNKLKQKIYFFV